MTLIISHRAQKNKQINHGALPGAFFILQGDKNGMSVKELYFTIKSGFVEKRGNIMEKSLDFERKLKKLLKSPLTDEMKHSLEFVPDEGRCTWMNAMCLSLAGKAAKGDIQAIKYINEICSRGDDNGAQPLSITVKVVE